jgi:mono/diheme cytochrome c family protein
MTSYETLMKGPPEGVVVFPGDVIASRLIETIESGDMPRGGGKVPANELIALKTWVAQGAKFDGADPATSFSGAAPAPEPMSDAPMVARATGKETVSFASHIAPLLVENCVGCHIDAMQVRGGLNMSTFAQLLRGGDSGAAITPGKGEASLLVRKLRGSEGDRMPAGGRPALSEESISLVSKWIDEGATLDGASENQPITVMSQLAWVAKATPAQVSERRAEIANEHFALANSANAEIRQETTNHFHVLGTVSAGTVKLVAEQAESLMPRSKTIVGGPDGEAYYRGRATIFVLPKRYDYSEFAKMVEQRGIPAEWESHWRFDGIDAYIALVASDGDEPEMIAQRLVTPIAALAMATRGGDVPRWLAEGVGVNLAASGRGMLDREARRDLESQIYEAAIATKDSKQFLEGKLTPDQSDRIGTAIVSTMVDRSRRRQFDMMLRGLESGAAFEAAFAKSFGVNIAGYVDAWLAMVRK